jgi:hypothetical protein
MLAIECHATNSNAVPHKAALAFTPTDGHQARLDMASRRSRQDEETSPTGDANTSWFLGGVPAGSGAADNEQRAQRVCPQQIARGSDVSADMLRLWTHQLRLGEDKHVFDGTCQDFCV